MCPYPISLPSDHIFTRPLHAFTQSAESCGLSHAALMVKNGFAPMRSQSARMSSMPMSFWS